MTSRSRSATNRTATTTTEFVDRCRSITLADLPERAREQAGLLCLDTVGVMCKSATSVESSAIVQDLATTVYGDGEATVAGAAARTSAPAAAFANGTIVHGLELDDTHSAASLHPGAVVLPTALAVSEIEGADGAALLEAVIAGYEMVCRVSRAADPDSLYERGFHPTSTCGVFGAALTAAKLQDCSLDETVNAVGIAGSFPAGNMEYLTDSALSKRIQPGVAAQAGVIAAALAARGYSGPRTIFEGDDGFLQGYSDVGDPGKLLADFDDRFDYEITRTGVKPHACCRFNQAPIDAALALRQEHDIEPDDVAAITVGLPAAALPLVAEPRERNVRPETPTSAQFSVQYSVAVALIEGRAFLEQYHPPNLEDEAVRSLAESVTVHADEDLEEYYPELFPARVAIELADGTQYKSMLETCRGDPSNPLSSAEIREKYDDLARATLDASAADALADHLLDLESVSEIRTVTDYLRG